MKKIIGIGHALVDVLVKIDDDSLLDNLGLPKGSMQFVTDESRAQVADAVARLEPQTEPGGSAANTMKALACMGVETAFIGKVGSDANGDLFRRTLEGQSVKSKLIVSPDLPTGTATTFISPDGERTFADNMGAAATFKPEDVTADDLKGYDVLYFEGYLAANEEFSRYILKLARDMDLEVCVDMASYNVVEDHLEFFNDILGHYTDIVFANEDEAFAFLGREALASIDMLKDTVDELAVVKLGAGGATAYTSEGLFAHSEAAPVTKVVDTTGAGDCFAAGFLREYYFSGDLARAVDEGNRIAAECIQHVGATLPRKTWKKLLEAYPYKDKAPFEWRRKPGDFDLDKYLY